MPIISLPLGETHYELTGPADGPFVVLLHGGSIPMWTWDPQVPGLAAAGFRVLRYDMYGKGRSASPRLTYDRSLFATQLSSLLDGIGAPRTFNLVGFSFGGATAANFASLNPDRVLRLALLAPVVHFAEGNSTVAMVRKPLIGAPFLHFVVMRRVLERASLLWSSTPQPTRYETAFIEQINSSGFEAALLSFMRGDALDSYEDVYRHLGKSHRPSLLLWGDKDQDIPRRHIERVRAAVPSIEYHELPGFSHGLTFEGHEVVTRHLLRFLRAEAATVW